MKKINLAISGCMGRMGQQLIKSAKKNKNFKLVTLTENRLINKKFNGVKLELNSVKAFKKTDVIIDFTVPSCTLEILKIASKLRKKLVIGTTGFTRSQENQIKKYSKKIPILKAGNMSLGVNLLMYLTEIASKSLNDEYLNKIFGRKTGGYIFNSARGIDNELVKPRPPTIQFSKITTLKKNSKELEFLQENVQELCIQLNKLAMENNKMYRSIGIQFVNEDLSTKTKSRMLRNPGNNLEELKKIVNQLLEEALVEQEMLVRRIGVRISEFSDVEGQSNITSYF